MDFNEYKNLSPDARNKLETTTTDVEELATLEQLKKQFEIEMQNEINAFKNDNKNVEHIVNSVNLENPETVEKVKTEIGLDEKLKGMDNEAEKLLNNQEAGEDLLELEIKKEIDPILEILCPEGEDLERYKESNISDLFETVISQNSTSGYMPNILSPEETVKQMKDTLHNRLKAVTEDIRDHEKRVYPEVDLVHRARIALLQLKDFSDLKKYFTYKDNLVKDEEGNIKVVSSSYVFSAMHNYLNSSIDYQKNTKITERELEDMGKTGLFSFAHLNLHDAEKSIDGIPEGIFSSILQASGSGSSNIERILKDFPSKKQYSINCLEQCIARGFTKTVFPYISRFEGMPVSEIIEAGQMDPHEALRLVNELSITPESKKVLTNELFWWNSMREGDYDKQVIKERFPDVVDKINLLRASWMDEAGQNQWDTIEPDSLIGPKIALTKELIQDGRIGFLSQNTRTSRYINRIAETEHDWLITQLRNNDQEKLGLRYFNDEEKMEYVNKLLSQGKEYLCARMIKEEWLTEGSLDQTVFEQLNNKDLASVIYQQSNRSDRLELSSFKNLDASEALRLITNGGIEMFVRNFNSFSVSEEFLKSPEVQKAALSKFKELLKTNNPEFCRKISDTIPLPQEQIDQEVLDKVKSQWIDHKNLYNSFRIIYQYPSIKEYLKNPLYQERAFRDMLREVEKGSIYYVAQMVECFPMPQSELHSPETIHSITEQIHKVLKNSSNDSLYDHLKGCFSSVDRINVFIPLPEYFNEMQQVVESIRNSKVDKFDLRPELVKKVVASNSPKEKYSKLTQLISEIENSPVTLSKEIVFAYISKFEENGTQEQKDQFFEDIKKDVQVVAENKPVLFSDNKDYYQYILQEVYPKRNYDTYKHLDQYEDRTKDLDKYEFDRNGYEMRLSGVLGYKIKEGVETNKDLIVEFSKRINAIKNISTSSTFSTFLEDNIENSQATTTEGKILEYFKQKGYSVDTMNVLLAYQLLDRYDDFFSGSVDRVAAEEGEVSKNYVLLDELVNQYGDNMKETIKSIQGKVATGEDRELFAGSAVEKYQKRYDELADYILADFNKIPRDKITDSTIQKKALKTIKNTFQNLEHVQERAEYFASLFTVNDLDTFKETWKRHVNELFILDDKNSIDTGKVESLQSSVYTKLQNEIGKYEEIKEVDTTKKAGKEEAKLSKERVIKGYFSKNKENAHARMVADVCLAGDPNMLKNEKYFEFVLFDEDREKCVGTTMLLEMNESQDGKKYLLYCPNPSVGLVSEVSAKKLYKQMTDQIIKFSKDNGFNGVLVNKTHGHSTNRAGLFQQSLDQSCLKDRTGKEKLISLKDSHALGGGYSYKDNLQIVWENNA